MKETEKVPVVRLLQAADFRDSADNFLQTRFWAEQKAEFGWKPYFFRVGDAASFDLMVLVRPIRLGLHLAYIPHAPQKQELALLSEGHKDSLILALLAKELAKLIPLRLYVLRFDLPWEIEAYPQAVAEGRVEEEYLNWNTLRKALQVPGLKKAPADIQPPDTVILDLRKSFDELLLDMKSKTRYNIRLATKKGVTVESAGPEKLEQWYELYQETASRDKIGIHPLAYYKRLFTRNPEKFRLYLASHEDQVLAGILVLGQGKSATYLYGASSNEKRNLMPSYALQGQALEEAQKQGFETYDLFGIPPDENPKHPMHGLYQVKTGYGGRIVHRYGTWDYLLNPFMYWLLSTLEALRFWILRRLKKL